jgi:hypothetical protein
MYNIGHSPRPGCKKNVAVLSDGDVSLPVLGAPSRAVNQAACIRRDGDAKRSQRVRAERVHLELGR